VLGWCAAVAATVLLALWLVPRAQPQRPSRAHRGAVEVAAVDPEAVLEQAGLPAGFIPLPDAEQIDPGDELDVVRMEIPGSALLAWGVPVDEDASARVEADVVFGGDGVARAVRFLD
jgi:hypothetical protein